MRRDPFVKQGEAELAFGHVFHYEVEGSFAGNVQIESVYEEKRVSGGKADAFVAVEKGVIVDQRLQQRPQPPRSGRCSNPSEDGKPPPPTRPD
jgi:hypothetical protein